MPTGFFPLSLIFFALATSSVLGQSQIGFISIDCGSREHLSYDDPDTGIKYSSDESFVDTGERKNISAEYEYPNNPTLPLPLSDLRSFPLGNKNCYSLRPSGGKGSLNLVRASFLYGNYDKENILPEFDLYLDVNFWFTVKFRNASDTVTTEVTSVAPSDTIHVCLLNKGLGTPFISALELRPLNSSVYNTELGPDGLLVLFNRWDIGYTNGSGRYQDDTYDRIWSPYSSPSWASINTSLEVNINENGYRAPPEVIKTAAMPSNGSDSLELYWTAADADAHFYIYMYFAELEQLRNQSRQFNVSWNGTPLFGPLSPRYLYAATVSNSRALVGKEHRISVYKTGISTLPPILNAVEIFVLKPHKEVPTYEQDVGAITSIKTLYQVKKYWAGDPCGPKNYTWEGLECSYKETNQPRIISLNLSSSGLTGGISASIAILSSLQMLDLSNNSLSGSIPEFLGELPLLKILNLKNNSLSGSVPSALLQKSKAGLKLLLDDQNACPSGSCKKKKNATVAIVASVSSAVALVIVMMIIWGVFRKWKSEKAVSYEGGSIGSKKQKFNYAEIINITNNFETVLGKGGFGKVYLGNMKDGFQVAVKMLSPSSSQGPKEFCAEAVLLMRVHHRNLASFIGYCDENNNKALIYEYMANGNLRDYLSDSRASSLSWEMRLRIAIDAAQGLEYLHQGCKPPIIHRDVKSANILLSEKLDAKIADFGLSKAIPGDDQTHVSTVIMGTRGYLDPEYYIMQKLTDKSDVYSFGIVLLELITGQHAIIKLNESVHILQWVRPMIERGAIKGIVDQRLQGDYDVNSVWKALEVAMTCTASSSIQRGSMSFVLAELKECLAMEIPRQKSSQTSKEAFYVISSSSSEVFSGDVDAFSGPSAR